MKIWHEKRAWVAKSAYAKAAALDPEAVARVAVIKHGALGDMLLTRPFLVTLRQHFPHAAISLSVVDHYQNGVPADLADHIQVALGTHSNASLSDRLRSYRQLGRHDILFDLTNSNTSFWISALTPARLKLGFRHRGIERLLYDVAVPRSEYRFEADSFLDQLRALGISPRWPLPFAMAALPSPRSRPFVVYFPTASTPDKCWPEEHFSALVGELSARYPQIDHLVLSGLKDWERAVAQGIAGAWPERGNVELVEAGGDDRALLQHALLVVAGDTGIRHLAIANHTPTLGIFSHTNPFRYWPPFDGHQVVFDREGQVPGVGAVRAEALVMLEALAAAPGKAEAAPPTEIQA